MAEASLFTMSQCRLQSAQCRFAALLDYVDTSMLRVLYSDALKIVDFNRLIVTVNP